MDRLQSRSDRVIHQFDIFLRTLMPHAATSQRTNPADSAVDGPLDDLERRHAASLMRITHTGEVGAQALYQGQSATAKLPLARKQMDHAALEELDHLAWCDERLTQLQSRTSYFNPLVYVASFGIGATTGVISDRISLGIVAAAQEELGRQLDVHQKALPSDDHRSRVILRQMAADEAHHAHLAIEAGGVRFPAPAKWGMRLVSKVMSKGVYHL